LADALELRGRQRTFEQQHDSEPARAPLRSGNGAHASPRGRRQIQGGALQIEAHASMRKPFTLETLIAALR
jgi:hypothetical protein